MPGVQASRPDPTVNTVAELWVDKYKPSKISELVGNAASVGRLAQWLTGWATGGNPRAALISGTPGIGKTSTARLVCEQVGYTPLEFNASDTRSKSAIDEMASGLSTNKVLFANGGAAMGAKVAIIMDEVDGMAGGDRGGSGALIQLIKKSKLPVICICNDRQDAKVRSLANHCLDLRFVKPTPMEIAQRALVVARAEKVEVTLAELAEIAESTSCDVRQVLNHLQLIKSSGNKNFATKAQKDDAMGPFEIVKGLFTSATARTWDYQKRNELFFIDYDLTPLLIQQNYLRCVEKVMDPRALPAMMKAAEFIAFGDVISRAIRVDSQWGLLPEYGTISTVAPAFACNNVLGYPEFPAWLGKQSSQGKNTRLFRELRSMMGPVSTCTARNLKLSGYSDVLYDSVVGQLANGGTIQATIAYLDALGVPKDSLFEVLAETRFTWQADPYASVDSKTKAALTRTYNAGNHLVRAGLTSGSTAKKTAAGGMQRLTEDDDEEGEAGEGDDVEEKDDKLVKQKSAPKKATARKK